MDSAPPPNTPATPAPPPSGENPDAPARRVFLAVGLDDAARGNLAEISQRLATAARFLPIRIAWVPPGNMHVTLHFLGSVPGPLVRRLADGIDGFCQGRKAFHIDIRGVGFFPNERQPKVLWAGIPEKDRQSAEEDPLVALQQALGGWLQDQGVKLQHQTFHGHVTLARIKTLKGTAGFVKQAKQQAGGRVFGTVAVGEVILMESLLSGGVPVYVPLARGRLGVEGAPRNP